MLNYIKIISLMVLTAFNFSWVWAGDLLIYTTQNKAYMDGISNAFLQKHRDIKIKMEYFTQSALKARLAKEFSMGDSPADVVMMDDTRLMMVYKVDQRLAALPDIGISELFPQARDEDKYYFPTKLVAMGIIYNTQSKKVPTSWKDLLNSSLKKQIVVASSEDISASENFYLSIFYSEELGEKYLKALTDNTPQVMAMPVGVLNSVVLDPLLYGIAPDYMAIRASKENLPVHFVLPVEGTVFLNEPIAVLKGSKNSMDAKKFVAFIVSEEGQQATSRLGYAPAHMDVPTPLGFSSSKKFKFLSVNAQEISKNAFDLPQKIREIFDLLKSKK